MQSLQNQVKRLASQQRCTKKLVSWKSTGGNLNKPKCSLLILKIWSNIK